MFSRRTTWDLRPNRWSALLQARRDDPTLLDLTQSNPTKAGLLPPSDLQEALTGERIYEPDPLGLISAREAVAADYKRRGFEIASGSLVLTSTTSEAYAFLFKLLCDPGDQVLVPSPSYPLFDYLAHLESLEVLRYPLRHDGDEWRVDLSGPLPARVRAIVLVNPNNPTGSFLKKGELETLKNLAGRQDVALISDEVFSDYAFEEDRRRVGSLASENDLLCFSLGGLSKSCGLPHLKLGWIGVSGPPATRKEALSRLEVVADTYLSVGTPVQSALPRILGGLEELQAPIRQRIAANVTHLRKAVREGVSLLRPEGGWSAVLRVPALLSEEQWALTLLEEDSVLVHPGYFFDFPSEAYLVVSLLPRPEIFQEGTARILERAVREASK